jgi:hypothetical protein
MKKINSTLKNKTWFFILLLLSSLIVHAATDTSLHTVVGHAPDISHITFDNTTPTVGDSVTVSATVSDPDGDTLAPLTYQWMLNGKDIAGETQKAYTIKSTDSNNTLKVKITASTDALTTDPATAEATSGELSPVTIDAVASTLLASLAEVPADNKTTSTISFTPKDAAGKVITGITASMVSFDITGLTPGLYSQSAVVKSGNTFTTTLKGIKAGTATVKVKINNIELTGKSTTVELTPLDIDFRLDIDFMDNRPNAQPGTILADGVNSLNAVLLLKTKDGKPVVDEGVTFKETGTSGLVFSPVTDQKNMGSPGQYYSTVKSTKAGSYTVMAYIDGHPVTGLNGNVHYIFGDSKGVPVSRKNSPDEMKVTVMPAVTPLVAHSDVTGYVGQTGLSAAATGGNPDATHPVTYGSADTSKVEVNAAGVLTLKADTGTTPVTITATEEAHGAYLKQTATMKVTVVAALTAVVATPTVSLTAGDTVPPRFLQPVTASHGTGVLHYAVSPTLPTGLSMDDADGMITGTPTEPSASTSYTVTVTDSGVPAQTATAVFSLEVNGAVGTPLVAHMNVMSVPGQTGLSAAARGGNTDATHPVTYKSADTSKVEVNAAGGLTLKGATGLTTPVTITATVDAHGIYSKQTATTNVYVIPSVALVAHADVTGVPTQTGLSAAATGGDTEGGRYPILYSSADPAKVAVDTYTGELTLKAATTTPVTITATIGEHVPYPEQTATMKVSVKPLKLLFRLDNPDSDGKIFAGHNSAKDPLNAVLRVATEDGQPVTGKTVKFTSAESGLTFTGSVAEQYGTDAGQYFIQVHSNKPGTYHVMASIDGHPITDLGSGITYAFGWPTIVSKTGPADMVVTVLASEPVDATKSSLTAAPNVITSNDADTSLITLVLKDANGRSVDYLNASDIEFVATGVGSTTIGPVKKLPGGTFTANLKGSLPGNADVTAKVNGVALSGLSASVGLYTNTAIAKVDREHATFAVDGSNTKHVDMWANNVDSRTLRFTPRDANGAVVAGLNVSDIYFESSIGGNLSGLTMGAMNREADGSFTQTVKGALNASSGREYNILVHDKYGRMLSDISIYLAMMVPNEANSSGSVSRKGAGSYGNANVTYTLQVMDNNNNGIPGLLPEQFSVAQRSPGSPFVCTGDQSMKAAGPQGAYAMTVRCRRDGGDTSSRPDTGSRTLTFDIGIKGFSWSKALATKY